MLLLVRHCLITNSAIAEDWSLPYCWTTCLVDVSAAAWALVPRLLLYCLAYGDGATAILAWWIVLPIFVDYLYTWKTITNVTKCFFNLFFYILKGKKRRVNILGNLILFILMFFSILIYKDKNKNLINKFLKFH